MSEMASIKTHHWAAGSPIVIGDGGYRLEVPPEMGDALLRIAQELHRARTKHPLPMRSTHEGYGVIAEEFDEMWDDIKKDDTQGALKECVQVGAMCLRYLIDMAHGRKSV